MPDGRYLGPAMDDIASFRRCAARYRNLLVEMEGLAADLRELEDETKDASGATNMDIRAMKRWLKADVKGKLGKLKTDAEQAELIGDILGLTDKISVDKKIVDEESDEEPPAPEAAPAGDSIGEGAHSPAAAGGPADVMPSSDDAPGRRQDHDNGQSEQPPNLTFSDKPFIPDMPEIPESMRRTAGGGHG